MAEDNQNHRMDFEHLADSLAQIVWTARPDGYLDYYNKRWYEFTGFSRGQGGDQSWIPLLHPNDVERTKAAWAESLKTGEDFNLEVRFRDRHQPDNFIWFLSTARAIRGPSGEITKWYGSCTNIDQQKRAEQQLVDILEGMNDSFFAIDADWNLSRVNSKMEATTQIRREDAVGKNFFKSFPMAEDSKYWINHHKIMKDRVRIQYEEYYEPLDLWTEARGYPTADGGIAYLFRDITVEKKALQRLEVLTAELQAAVDARDRFLSICSHELRTPITAMRLQAQTMDRRLQLNDQSFVTPERVTKLVAQTNRGLDRVSRLVEDMLDISRIQSGKLALNLEETDLVALVQDVIERFREQMTAAGIEMKLTVEGAATSLSLDRFRIEQVLTNLMTNAIRYAPRAPVTVSLDFTGKDFVTMAFQDGGPGIATQDQEKVFQKFERLISPSEVSGLGLGLYIVREIIKAHGGSVYVDPSSAGGARFMIRLAL